MSDTYTVLVPKVTAAVFAPNPADINTRTLISVTVTEEAVYLEPVKYYAGEFYSGEV